MIELRPFASLGGADHGWLNTRHHFSFADASSAGSIGPSLDRNPRLTKAHAVDVITHGQGPMPAFAGQMSDAEIARLADYLVAFARK